MRARLGATFFLGRDDELASLRSLLDRVDEGRGCVAVVEGEPGIGKTRLLDELLTHAKSLGFEVFRASADEFARDRPFGAIADAFELDPRSPDTDRAEIGKWLVGESSESEPSTAFQVVDLGFRIVESVTTLIEELSAESRLAIGLEDLQWADPSTLRTVHALLKRLAPLQVVVILTFRPHPRSAELDRVVEAALREEGQYLRLQPLADTDVVDLAAEIVSANPGPNLIRLLEGAGGNPLFIIELARALRDEGSIDISGGIAEIGRPSVPSSLRATILRRLTVLGSETLEVLRVASILGSTFSAAELSNVTGRRLIDLLSLLTEAVQAGFLGEREEHLSFRHDVIREALYFDMPAPIRKGMHRHAAGALARAGVSLMRVAEHLSLGAEHGDAEAIATLHEAGREVAPRSAQVAANLLDRALQLSDAKTPDRGKLVSDLALAQSMIGRYADAKRLLEGAVRDETDLTLQMQLRRGLAIVMFYLGERRKARDLMAFNANVVGAATYERAIDLSFAALLSPYVPDLEGGWNQGREAVALSKETGNAMATSIALVALSLIARYKGLLTDAISFGAEAIETAPVTSWAWTSRGNIGASYPLAAAYLEADRLNDADEEFRRGSLLNELSGDIWQHSLHAMGLAAKHFVAGEWDAASAEAFSCLALAAQTESTYVLIFANSVLGAIGFFRGDLEGAEASIQSAEQVFATSGPQFGVETMFWIRGLLLEEQTEVKKAFSLLSSAWDLFESFGCQLSHRWIAPDVVRLALEVGERDRADKVARDLAGYARQAKVPSATGAALLCTGLVNADPDGLVEAVQAYRQGPRPFETALACQTASTVLTDAGRTGEAVTLLEEALNAFERLEARRQIDKSTASLRSLGVRRRSSRAKPRPTTGWESLTETERRVVALVAKGLTNRQIGEQLFTSRRTVETHVGHMFAKLGLSTRAELAVEASRQLS